MATAHEALTVATVSEFPEYALSRDESVTLLLTVKAASAAASFRRPPLNLVLAIDVSKSMRPTFPLVKRTAQFIIKHADARDSIAVIAFNDTATRVFKFALMTAENKAIARAAVENLEASGSTNMGEALESIAFNTCIYRAQTSGDYARPRVWSAIFLTDGSPTAGVVDATQLLKLAADMVPVVSLHVIGIGHSVDATFLRKLAAAHHGNFYPVSSDESIAAAFGDCVGGLASTVARNVRLTLRTANQGVTAPVVNYSGACEVDTVAGKKAREDEISVTIPDMQQEEERHILITVDVARAAEPVVNDNTPVPTPLLLGSMAYQDMSNGQEVVVLVRVGVARVREPDMVPSSAAVDEQRNRMTVVTMSNAAVGLADYGKFDSARAVVDSAIDVLRRSVTALTDYTSSLIANLQNVRAGLKNRTTYYADGGRLNAMGICALHAAQRSAGMTEGSEAYATSAKSESQQWFVHECASNVALPDDGEDDDDEPAKKRARVDSDPAQEQSQAF